MTPDKCPLCGSGRTHYGKGSEYPFASQECSNVPCGLPCRLLGNTPAWVDRPSRPGIWVCFCSTGQFRMTVLELDDADIKRGAPFHTEKVYGPIPRVPDEIKAAEAIVDRETHE